MKVMLILHPKAHTNIFLFLSKWVSAMWVAPPVPLCFWPAVFWEKRWGGWLHYFFKLYFRQSNSFSIDTDRASWQTKIIFMIIYLCLPKLSTHVMMARSMLVCAPDGQTIEPRCGLLYPRMSLPYPGLSIVCSCLSLEALEVLGASQ